MTNTFKTNHTVLSINTCAFRALAIYKLRIRYFYKTVSIYHARLTIIVCDHWNSVGCVRGIKFLLLLFFFKYLNIISFISLQYLEERFSKGVRTAGSMTFAVQMVSSCVRFKCTSDQTIWNLFIEKYTGSPIWTNRFIVFESHRVAQ